MVLGNLVRLAQSQKWTRGGTWFEYLPVFQLSWLGFSVVFVNSSRQIPRYYLHLGHGCLLANLYLLTINYLLISFNTVTATDQTAL
jgi:hypothetical protein